MSESERYSSVTVDFDTTKLIKKLRVIAEHAESLANELEAIDKELCDVCGGHNIDKAVFCVDGENFKSKYFCNDCDNKWDE